MPAHAAGVDSLLQISRRIDWRFLLSEPNPESIAYFGRADASLLGALEQLMAPVARDPVTEPRAAGFALVVLKEPAAATLERALGHVRPGGHLYLETRSRSAALARDLATRGFCEVRRHWHWPDFERCSALLELDGTAALEYFLRRRGTGWRGRMLGLGGRALVQSGLVEQVAKHTSVVARRRAA